METTDGLGDLIRRQRLRRGWTQQQLGERLGVEKSYVSAMETGARKWPQEYIAPLARLLGFSQVEMAIAAGLIEREPGRTAPPVVNFRLDDLIRAWPRLRPEIQQTMHEWVGKPVFYLDADDPGVVALAR